MTKHEFTPDRSRPLHEQVATYVQSLQQHICSALESIESTDKKFVADRYTRAEGAGFGISSTLAGGSRIEKAGVGVSVSRRPISPTTIQQMRATHAEISSSLTDAQSSHLLQAASISLIVHPRNPMAPTVHMNYRYFEIIQSVEGENASTANAAPLVWWFGGGCDLTPSYVFEEDAVHFHTTIKTACDAHGAVLYPAFKRWCDEYFFIPHRGESRGLGGIFFDDLSALPHARLPEENGINRRPSTPEAIFDFLRECGDAFVPSYIPILQRRVDMPFTEDERRWQLLRRGRYVEFNLMYDRGTKFGMSAAGARVESILMSLPETARWEYCTDMGAEGTREGELLALLRTPKDWLPHPDSGCGRPLAAVSLISVMSLVGELKSARSWASIPLDPELLSLRPDEAAFFKEQTGIADDEELRQHIIAVQADAYKVAPYPCIRRFGFTRLKISRHPAYKEILSMGRTQSDALLLDFACCVGNDTRKAVADGWPADRAFASDLHAEFWDIGQKLFRAPTTIRFIPVDLFEDASLKTLADEGPFAAIHVAAFFHLFPLEQQRSAATRILSLLSKEPGSTIFGSNIGSDVEGSSLGRLPYLHNAESWKEMWKSVQSAASNEPDHAWVFEAELRTLDGYLGEGVSRRTQTDEAGVDMKWLVWRVQRK